MSLMLDLIMCMPKGVCMHKVYTSMLASFMLNGHTITDRRLSSFLYQSKRLKPKYSCSFTSVSLHSWHRYLCCYRAFLTIFILLLDEETSFRKLQNEPHNAIYPSSTSLLFPLMKFLKPGSNNTSLAFINQLAVTSP